MLLVILLIINKKILQPFLQLTDFINFNNKHSSLMQLRGICTNLV